MADGKARDLKQEREQLEEAVLDLKVRRVSQIVLVMFSLYLQTLFDLLCSTLIRACSLVNAY